MTIAALSIEATRLGELLVSFGALGEAGLALALRDQREHGGNLGEALVRLDLVDAADVEYVAALQRAVRAGDAVATMSACERLVAHTRDMVRGERAHERSATA